MTNDQIRIAVAEECGAHHIVGSTAIWPKRMFDSLLKLCRLKPQNSDEFEGEIIAELPNYPESLDACAEFEKSLNALDVINYIQELRSVVIGKNTPDLKWLHSSLPSSKMCIFSTPLQRCEAFLRLKWKWVE